MTSERRKNGYLLFLLALVALSQQADKLLFSMALEAIKTEYQLNDGQLGLINGLAFALLYGFASIPLAHLAETKGRIRVISFCAAAWSLFTILTAAATGFFTLFLLRVLVGLGEAGSGPASQSLIAARFPPAVRAGAISKLLTGSFLGITIGLGLGGFLVEEAGWRGAFIIMGAFGLVVAPLLWLTVREPELSPQEPGGMPMKDLFKATRTPAFIHLFAMFAIISLNGYGMLAWAPSFYIREFGMSTGSVGIWLGVAVGGGTVVGGLLGGWIGDRLNQKVEGASTSMIIISLTIASLTGIFIFLVESRQISLALLMINTIVGTMLIPPTYAALHGIVEPRLRAMAVASCSLAVMLVGRGLGSVLNRVACLERC